VDEEHQLAFWLEKHYKYDLSQKRHWLELGCDPPLGACCDFSSQHGLVWQNRLNYSGSSALLIAVQPQSAQRTSNGTILWSVGSPPDTTTVQQDRSRFTSHEGEFTSRNSSSTFNLQPYIHYYKLSLKISKLIQKPCLTDKHNSLSKLTAEEKVFTRLHTPRRRTPSLDQGLVSLWRVCAGRGRVPLHGPAKRNGRWPHKVVRGILVGCT
jgi:hypothetical protein